MDCSETPALWVVTGITETKLQDEAEPLSFVLKIQLKLALSENYL